LKFYFPVTGNTEKNECAGKDLPHALRFIFMPVSQEILRGYARMFK